VLKGAGVALSVPWLETFAPSTAKAQAAAAKKRFISLYFPNGCADFWHPTGSGATWGLSPIWEPLTPLKDKVIATQNLTYQGVLQKPNPSHSQLCASMWSCVQADPNPANAKNGTTVDQMIATAIAPTAKTPLASLQVGLSTLDSYADGRHGAHSRSISWSSPTTPLYKIVSPQGVFDRLVGMNPPPAGTPMATDPLAERRRQLKKSALDYVIENTMSLQGRLSKSDKTRLDQYLTSTRNLETRVLAAGMPMQAGCTPGTRPTETFMVGNIPPTYNRDKHADLMTDLVVMGLQCDATRVVSYMLDDARSDYAYTFLQARNFTATGSTAAGGMVSNGNIADGLAGYHGLQHAGDTNNGFATINYWMTLKAAALATKLKASMEGATNILDQSVIVFGSGMHGGNHEGIDIPVVLIGSGGGVLKQNVFANFPATQLIGNVHLTIMQKVFGMTNATFPMSTGIIPEILA